jgi:hypothetical protein
MTRAVSAAPQPAAHLVVSQPLAGPLSNGLVVITFRTENLKIVPVYGETASQVVPRLGHLHITVDDIGFTPAKNRSSSKVCHRGLTAC